MGPGEGGGDGGHGWERGEGELFLEEGVEGTDLAEEDAPEEHVAAVEEHKGGREEAS